MARRPGESEGSCDSERFASTPRPESVVSLSGTGNLIIEHAYGRRARQSLEDILDFAADAAELVSRGRQTYDSDRMLQLAAEAISGRIGEAASRLPAELLSHHTDVPFRLAKDLRYFVSHEYDRVDPAVVWETLEHQIPTFAHQIREMLRG